MQNHTVIYYDCGFGDDAEQALGQSVQAESQRGLLSRKAAMVVKAAGVTPTPEQWPVLEGSAIWNVYPAHRGRHGPDAQSYTNPEAGRGARPPRAAV